MVDQLRAELLKVRSTRTALGLIGAMIGLTLLFTILTGLLNPRPLLYSRGTQDDLFAVGGVGYVFSALSGVLLITSEYRHGTIRPTFLFTPRRMRVLTAKLIAGALTGLIFGVVTVAISFGVGSLILSERNIPSALTTGDMLQLTLGGVGAVAIFGIVGVGVGAILRNQVVALIAMVVWDFFVNTLLFGLVPKVGHFMPTPAADGLMGLKNSSDLLAPLAGGLVLAAWALALAAIGAVITARRDVS